MIQYRYKGGDYYEFLRRIPYAEAPTISIRRRR